MSISLQTSSFDNVSHNAKPSRFSHNSLWYLSFAGSLITLYQLCGWNLNANHGEIDCIYMTNNITII